MIELSNSIAQFEAVSYFCAAMARTYTSQIPLGYQAPDFLLPDPIHGTKLSYEEISGELGTVLMFICNHCPFVVHVKHAIASLADDYQSKGIGFVAINSNDVINYPQDSPELMGEFAKEAGFNFPYLFDESQEVAKAYDAACTPDFSIFDKDSICVYRGQLDASRPGNDVVPDAKSIREVLDLLIGLKPVPSEGQIPSIGCNIKWK